MSMTLWTSFFMSATYRMCGRWFCVCVYHVCKPTSIFSHHSLETGQEIHVSTLPVSVLAGSLAPFFCPVSRVHLLRWFTFWFPTRHLVSTEWAKEDQGFHILSRTTASFGHVGRFDQVLWVGHGPGSSHWMSGMGHSKCGNSSAKDRHNITKIGDAVAKVETWPLVKEPDSEESSQNCGINLCCGNPSNFSVFSGVLGCTPWGPECGDWPTLWNNQELRGQNIDGQGMVLKE